MKAPLTFIAYAATSAVLFASACSPSAPADPLASETGFCQEKAKAECQVSAVCAIDPAACMIHRNEVCLADAMAAMADGRRTYVSGNAQMCLDALNQAYGNNNPIITFAKLEGPGSITDKCNRVFSGNAAVNAVCQSDYDCASNRICAPIGVGSAMRVCADSVAQNVDGFCANPGSTCAVDTYCAVRASGAAPQCTAAAAIGESCVTAPCVSAAQCVGGLCVPRQGPGGGCTTSDQCGPVDPYCDLTAGGICTLGLTFATGASDCHAYEIGGDGGNQTVTATPMADAASATDASGE